MIINKKINIFIILIYFSLLFGFFYGEDSIGGAFTDYKGLSHISEKFKSNFLFTLLSYDDLGHRQSPVFYILKSIFLNFGEFGQRIFFLHLFLLIPIFFYKSLKLVFKNTSKNYLKFISLLIILFPTFRSYSIWPDPHLLGTLFFVIAIYFYLKFMGNCNNLNNALFNTFFLSLSAYCSPNFGVFVIFFLFQFYQKLNLSKNLFIIILLNIFLSLPFFYYLFFLEINFIFNKNIWNIGSNFYSLNNIANKIIITISVFLFYLFPFILSNKINYNFEKILKKKINSIIYILFFFIICYFFNFSYPYSLTNSGGGFFYNLSMFLFSNNYILFVICFFTYLYLLQIFQHEKSNLILFIVLILSNPQITLWQANFSPTMFFLILMLFNLNFKDEVFNLKTIYINYFYFTLYLIGSIGTKVF